MHKQDKTERLYKEFKTAKAEFTRLQNNDNRLRASINNLGYQLLGKELSKGNYKLLETLHIQFGENWQKIIKFDLLTPADVLLTEFTNKELTNTDKKILDEVIKTLHQYNKTAFFRWFSPKYWLPNPIFSDSSELSWSYEECSRSFLKFLYTHPLIMESSYESVK